jgi:phytoene dehydrogenase-like protein
LQVRIPSLADSSLAPAGKSVMSVHMQYAPYKLREGKWDDAARTALGDRVLAILEEYAPGISRLVIKRQVLTPADLEADFSLPEGHAYHGELTLDQILFMRPVAGSSRYAAPAPGLFMCGAGTHPGGGIVGGSGVLAAREILRHK